MSYKNKKNKKTYPNKFLIIALCIVLICGLLFVLEKTGIINLYERTQTINETNQDDIDLSPPTEEELQAVEDNKQKLSSDIENEETAQVPTQTVEGKTPVTPAIGYIEVGTTQINANGFISTMIEDGGTCTLTLRKGDQSVQTSTTSLADAQSTVCGLMQISKSEVGNGEWIATLTYSSAKYEGVSDEQAITVQ